MKSYIAQLLCCAAAALSAALMGCAAPPPSPELVRAAASPTADTPPVVDGETLRPCRAEQSFVASVTIDAQAAYSPGYTFTFAQKFRNGAAPLVPYADAVRAYVLKGQGTNLVGTPVSPEIVCYYELKDGRLRYLTMLSPDRDGRVPVTTSNRAVLKAYAIMAGKNVGAVQLFGVYAN